MTLNQTPEKKLGLTCASNLESLRSPITKMHKATQNVEIEVVYGGKGSPKVIGNITI